MKITTLWQINCQPQKHFKTLYPGIGKHLDKVQCKVYSKIPSKNRATFSSLVKGQFVLVCGTWTEMSASTACSRNCSSTVMRSHRPHMNSVSESYLLPKRTLQIAVSMQKEHSQNLWSERKGRGCKHNATLAAVVVRMQGRHLNMWPLRTVCLHPSECTYSTTSGAFPYVHGASKLAKQRDSDCCEAFTIIQTFLCSDHLIKSGQIWNQLHLF